VTLALDHPLAPGASYRLVVPTSLRDVAARTPVAEYDLSFTGPFTPSS
jgi:hypothetical protein